VTEPSQCARVLAVLQDGKPHSIQEIHERAGTMRLNSRVSELRTRGHPIRCWRTRTRRPDGRPDWAYWYQLTPSPLPQPEEHPTPSSGSGSGPRPADRRNAIAEDVSQQPAQPAPLQLELVPELKAPAWA
jgi:hypothetical protein